MACKVAMVKSKDMNKALNNILNVRGEAVEYVRTTKSVCGDRIEYYNYLIQQACMDLASILGVTIKWEENQK